MLDGLRLLRRSLRRARRGRTGLVPLVLLLGSSACTDAKKQEDPGELEVPQVEGQSLLVLNLDTMRQDRLPFAGYGRETLPLSAVRPWYVVDGLWSSASWTVPATATQLSGRPPHLHRVRDADMPGQSGELVGTFLTEHLEGLGWETAIFAGNPYFGRVSAFPASAALTLFPDEGSVSNTRVLTETMLGWLGEIPAEAPFFAWVQPMDAHGPWDPQPEDFGTWADPEQVPFDINDETEGQEADLDAALAAATDPGPIHEAVSAVYDEQLIELDRALYDLLNALDRMDRLDSTVVVITADHGEQLFDRGDNTYGHVGILSPAVTRVPLALLHPDLPEGTEPCLASSTDLAPTLLDLLGLAALPGATGRSLRDSCRGVVTSESWAVDEITLLSASTLWGRMEIACGGGRAVGFDMVSDPQNQNALPVDVTPDAAILADALAALAADIQATDGSVCDTSALDGIVR